MKPHVITRLSKNQGIEQEIIPTCSCGWKGWTEYAHNDHMYSNLKDQEEKHLKDSNLFLIEKLATEFCDQYLYKEGTKVRREAHNAFCVGFSFGKKHLAEQSQQ